MKKTKILLYVFFIFSILASLFFGSQTLQLSQLFSNGDNFSKSIFFTLRIPRTILVLITGMLLSGSGLIFQKYFRNPLSDPGLLGISAGATLGACVAFFFGLWLNAGAFLGAIASGFLIILLSSGKKTSAVTVLLCGCILGTFFSALTSIFMSATGNRLSSMYLWMLGSFNGRGWQQVKALIIPSAVCICCFFPLSKELNLLNGGEEKAQSLGQNINLLRSFVLLCGTLAVSCSVCAGGTIGFVGLIAPHICRRLFREDKKDFTLLVIICGATILLTADVLCRLLLAPREINIGIVTSLLGAPLFISMMLKSSKPFFIADRFDEQPYNYSELDNENLFPAKNSVYSLLNVELLTADFSSKPVISDLNFELKQGQIICLCGSNGSGKSTLLKTIAQCDSQIKINGNIFAYKWNSNPAVKNNPDSVKELSLLQRNYDRTDFKQQAQVIAYLSQSQTFMWPQSVKDFILDGRFCYTGSNNNYTNKDYIATGNIIKKLELQDIANQNILELSGGQMQKVRIAQTFVQNSDFLLLDEPLAALDFNYEQSMLYFFKEIAHNYNKGMLISIHNLEDAKKIADKVLLLPSSDKKNLLPLFGTPEEILTPDNIKDYY